MWSTLAVVLCGLQAAQAVNVYLYPPQTFLRGEVGAEDASAALSRHLGLEIFEPLRDSSVLDYTEEFFVGKGHSNVLLLTMDHEDARALHLPSSLRPSFEILTPPSSPVRSLSSVISTYMHRAKHVYSSIYSSDPFSQSRPAWFTAELDTVRSLFIDAKSSAFAAAELSGLSELRAAHGIHSDEYRSSVSATQQLLDFAVDNEIRVALLTFSVPTSTPAKRDAEPQPSQAPFPRPPPQSPMDSISTCHSTVDACTNATSSCSGRGECLAATKLGNTCFVCSCRNSRAGTGNQVKTDRWVGESCERKDVSGPFVLFAGTTIVLLIVVAGSVSLLYSIGNVELPSVLLGAVVNAKKD
ncbi:unnamed protein product [Mycena citricolor]|uniref:Vacuolar sorting protein Vps3844 C-terminal domain-containing protein n=1 Tax=Mycena citricolor TaxID=2018698 RepID=A0AAD2JW80_9AGAR|nr:unnamed protein product [Mycena citricolor]CAK5281233.1 unnamed protein product [Mycena citricolor]